MSSPLAITTQAAKELSWAGSLLKLELNSLDQLASGAVYCQLLDIIYNGMVPMDRVNWTSDKPADFITNFELLKGLFTKFSINRDFNIEKLVSGDRSELFTLLQWIHIFSFSTRNLGKGYDPTARRFGNEPTFTFVERIRSKNQETDFLLLQNAGSMKQEQLPLSNKENQLNITSGLGGSNFTQGGVGSGGAPTGFRVMNLEMQVVQKLAHYDSLQKENEFYLNKLKEIDLVLDTFKNGTVEGIIQTIKDIINLPQEKLGFVTDDGRFQLLDSVNASSFGQQQDGGNPSMQTELLESFPNTADRFDRLHNISANFGGTGGAMHVPGSLDEEGEGLGGFDLLAEDVDSRNA